MITPVIYGFFGLLSASVIALAIYIDKPAPTEVPEVVMAGDSAIVEEASEQSATVAVAGSTSLKYEVIKVIDGDTISVQKSDATETVRMIGVDAPETGQCYTSEATQKLKSLLAGGTVSLELDPGQGVRDKYDRLLAYVFSESGTNTAEVLIEGGFAKEYTYSRAYKYQADFKAAQASAQAGGKGLWAPGACASAAPAPAAATPAPPVQQASAPAPQPAPTAKKTEPVKVTEEPTDEPREEEEPEEEEQEDDDPPSTTGYTCSTNTYNCDDFSSHAEAQAVFDACGGSSNDVHKLDANKDGQACESLP